jgi:hypothetical protein
MRPCGLLIAARLQMVFAAVPTMVKTPLARADSGFYCWDAVQACESVQCGFIIVVTPGAFRSCRTASRKSASSGPSDPIGDI